MKYFSWNLTGPMRYAMADMSDNSMRTEKARKKSNCKNIIWEDGTKLVWLLFVRYYSTLLSIKSLPSLNIFRFLSLNFFNV